MDAEQKELIFQLKQRIDVLEKEHKKLEGIKQIFNDYGISLKTLEEEDLTDFERDIIREVLEDLEDVYNMVKSTDNASNQLRYDEYLRILKESDMFSKMNAIELTSDSIVKKIVEENEMLLNMNKSLKEENKILRQVCDVEILPMEEAAIELGQGTVYTTYDWYNTLNQFKNLGLSVCKVKGVKDEQ